MAGQGCGWKFGERIACNQCTLAVTNHRNLRHLRLFGELLDSAPQISGTVRELGVVIIGKTRRLLAVKRLHLSKVTKLAG